MKCNLCFGITDCIIVCIFSGATQSADSDENSRVWIIVGETKEPMIYKD